MKITMKDRVLKYMQDFGSITTKQAFIDLGNTRLSEYIRQLRLDMDIDDIWIKSKNRYGEIVHFKKYWIRKEEKNGNN